MHSAVGAGAFDDLLANIPRTCRRDKFLSLPYSPPSEWEFDRHMDGLSPTLLSSRSIWFLWPQAVMTTTSQKPFTSIKPWWRGCLGWRWPILNVRWRICIGRGSAYGGSHHQTQAGSYFSSSSSPLPSCGRDLILF